MKTSLPAIIFLSLMIFNNSAQTSPGPTPYGYGTFLSFDPISFQVLPFYGGPAYFQNSDAIYATAGPDNSSSIYNGDDFSYALQSNLNPTSSYQDLLESPGGPDGGDSPMPTPAIGNDGTTYVVTPSGILYALNPNGTAKWIYSGISSDGGNVYASPSIGLDGNIYIATDDGNRISVFYCIDPDLGLPKWKLHLNSPFADMDASPLCTTSGIYDVDEDGFLHFITYYGQEYAPLSTGSAQGSYPSSSPAITGQGLLCVGTGDGNLEIIDPITRQIVQETAAPLDGTPISASPVIGPDGNIYVGTTGGNFFAVQLPANEQTQPPTAIAATSLGGLPTTAAVGSDSRVYVGTSSDASGSPPGLLYSMHLNAVSGQTYPYQFVTDWQTSVANGGFLGSPLIAQVGTNHNNNVVYDGNVNGNVYAFLASAGPSTTTWSTFHGNDQRQGSWGSGSITPPHLWNVQFTAPAYYHQNGKAAYGNSSGDFWNVAVVPTPNNPPNPYVLLDSTDNPNGINTAVFLYSGSGYGGITVAPGYKPFNDNLMKNEMTANGSFTLNIQAPYQGGFNGGPALYDIYVYAYGGQGTNNGTVYSVNSTFSISTPGTDPVTGNPVITLTTSSTPPPDLSHFIEGSEYVVFRDVPFTSANFNVKITVSKDPNNPISFPIVNGIQIVAKQ